MNMFQILVYAGLSISLLFLVAGFLLMLLGEKRVPDGKNSARIEVDIAGQSLSVPYQMNIILCIIGALLLFLTFNLYKNSGSPGQMGALPFLQQAYAQTSPKSQLSKPGWAYFGYEKNPESWNFEILNGTFEDLLSRKNKIVLKSKKEMNIREKHFGNFTGTILNFLTPAPKVIEQLPVGSCVRVTDMKSIGFSKIWIKIESHQCPGN